MRKSWLGLPLVLSSLYGGGNAQSPGLCTLELYGKNCQKDTNVWSTANHKSLQNSARQPANAVVAFVLSLGTMRMRERVITNGVTHVLPLKVSSRPGTFGSQS